MPTDIGMIVNDFLVNNFENILDYNFTAQVEQNFDEIAEEEDWVKMIKVFMAISNRRYHVKEARRTRIWRAYFRGFESGRTVKVRLGKFGPIAQIGDADDEEAVVSADLNPRSTVECHPFDEEALDLFNCLKT